jgi:NADPH:quinone reductase-like Zn-dependent oxidoreductase
MAGFPNTTSSPSRWSRRPFQPGPHQIVVKVGAVYLNYRDKLALDGEFGRNHELPIVPHPMAPA